MRYLSEFFWRHSWDVGTLFRNNFEFLVCQSLSWLTSLLKLDKGISPVLNEIFFLNFLKTFLRCWCWFKIILTSLYVCQSGSLVLPYWNPTNLRISPALDEISFWIFMDKFLVCVWTDLKLICISDSLFIYFTIGHFLGSTSESFGVTICLSEGDIFRSVSLSVCVPSTNLTSSAKFIKA